MEDEMTVICHRCHKPAAEWQELGVAVLPLSGELPDDWRTWDTKTIELCLGCHEKTWQEMREQAASAGLNLKMTQNTASQPLKCEHCGQECADEDTLEVFHRACRMKAQFPDACTEDGPMLIFDPAKMNIRQP